MNLWDGEVISVVLRRRWLEVRHGIVIILGSWYITSSSLLMLVKLLVLLLFIPSFVLQLLLMLEISLFFRVLVALTLTRSATIIVLKFPIELFLKQDMLVPTLDDSATLIDHVRRIGKLLTI